MATFRRRGNLQWEAGIRKWGYPTTCKTFETKAEAEQWAKGAEAEMSKGPFVSTKEAESYTLSECLDRYKEEYLPRLKDHRREISRAKCLQSRAIARRVMSTIRSKDMADYLEKRSKSSKDFPAIFPDEFFPATSIPTHCHRRWPRFANRPDW